MGGPSYITQAGEDRLAGDWTTGSDSRNGGQQEERLQKVKPVPLFI